jgi:hypothetical protein
MQNGSGLVVQVPQTPPQPSGPHVLPLQSGTQTQFPVASQDMPGEQDPQLPPHPLLPQLLPLQLGEQL